MKFDHDFARAILLKIENSDNPSGIWFEEYQSLTEENNKSTDELAYTMYILENGGFISHCVARGNDKLVLRGMANLNFKGHEYLDNIRDDKVWKTTKKIASKTKSVSLDIMSKIATDVIVKLITQN